MSTYAPVSTNDSIELADVALHQSHGVDAADVDDATPSQQERQPLTKRAVYSSHRIEARTPRLDGETDAAYKRRITTQHLNAIMHSIGWVLAAGAIAYYSDIWNVIRYDQRVNQSVARHIAHPRLRNVAGPNSPSIDSAYPSYHAIVDADYNENSTRC